MSRRPHPLVAVVTPVYNGGDSLVACLESVRRQSYKNWIHLVVDNASHDNTLQLAESFAATDDRVMVHSFRERRPMMENFNRALAIVPSTATYFKQLHADDILHPDCLMKMVATAERNPDAALVVSRFYLGGILSPKNSPRQTVRLPGRTAAREALLGTSNVLGAPSVQMMRIERMVGWPSLFPVETFPPGHPAAPPHNQADKEACLSSLEQSDLVFVPEPLMSLSVEHRSATGFARRVGGWQASRVDLLLRRGERFMCQETLRRGIRHATWKWIRSIAWRRLKQLGRIDQEFSLYQSLCLANLVPRLREAGYTSEAATLAWFRFRSFPHSDRFCSHAR